MSEEDIKRDINGFGSRLNELALKQADCAGRTGERLKQVEESNDRRDEQITRIFQSQEDIKVTVAGIKSTIRTWGVVIGFASPLIAAIVAAVVGRVMG